MTVAINGRGMTSESSESKQESNHEFNFFIDRQLQNNLLQADDDLLAEKESGDKYIASNNIKSGKSTKTDLKVDKFGDFTGWFPDQKLVCRKLDGAKSDQKPRESTFIHPWKDYKKTKEENYAFKHYTDTRKYIEQYRKEHCRQSQNNRFSSGGTDRERRYAYPNHTSQPPPVQVQVQALWKGLPVSAAENPALHYSNRKDSLGTLVAPTPTQNSNCSCSRQNHSHQPDLTSQAHRYKLVPSPFTRTNAADLRSQHGDSDNSSESGDSRTKTPRPRINSAASVTGRAIMKSPTKISVPAQGVHNGVRPYPIQALTIQQTSIKSGSDPGPPPSSSPKPLDNLNVVAPEKQKRLHDHPDLEGLTWAEKLEFLRSVNKRPEKPKPKPQKLRYVKDEPEPLPTSEHEQLYEQRRIKHLVEQARMKGGKQFDWVNEAKVKVKSVDRASGKVKPAADPSPVYDDSDHSSIGSACDEEFEDERKFGKYGIYVPQKGAPKKLFDCHNIARSNTCMFSS